MICIPVLREQEIIKSTIYYFSKLNYPKNKYQIIITSTEKESFDKQKNKTRMNSLAYDLSKNINANVILDRYLGLFTHSQLIHLHKKYNGCKYKLVLNELFKDYDKLPSTYELACRYAQEVNKKIGLDLIRVVNYPKVEGIMSHQINYALNEIKKEYISPSTFFAIYNADSRPNPDTLLFIAKKIQKLEHEKKKPNIIQQSSLFTLNYNRFPRTLKGLILKTASIFQTKWTLVHELHRFKTHSKKVNIENRSLIDILANVRLSHCVGHGLFIRLSILQSINSIPIDTITEDLPFGFYKCCEGEAIYPIPILENSESPTTLDSLVNQKRVWFTPYLEYIKYRKKVLLENKFRKKLEVDFLTLQGIWTGFIWLVQSFVFLIPLILSILTLNFSFFVIWIFALALYWYIPVFIIYSNLKKLEAIAGRSITVLNHRDYLFISSFGLFIIFTHSFGPFLRTFDFIKEVIFDINFEKKKTER